MQDAYIITGFAHGQQWLNAGVTVCVPDDLAQAWADRGLATLSAGQPQDKQSKPTKTRSKKAA